MPINSPRFLLGYSSLITTQLSARIYDEMLSHQFKEVMSRLETIAFDDLPDGTVRDLGIIPHMFSISLDHKRKKLYIPIGASAVNGSFAAHQ